MYKIVTHSDRDPKWYDPETKRIKCNFCDDYYQLSAGEYECRMGPYYCERCTDAMTKKYQYTWLNKRAAERKKPGIFTETYKDFPILDEHFLFALNEKLAIMCPICRSRHMERDDTGYFNICKPCATQFPGYDDYERQIGDWKMLSYKGVKSPRPSLIVEPCDKHGFYVTTQRNKNLRFCPQCSEEARTVTCVICGETYITNDMHVDRIRDGRTLNVCDSCRSTLSGSGPVVRYCSNCDSYVLVSNNLASCPVCDSALNPYEIICKECGKKKIVYNNQTICNDCKNEGLSENVKMYANMRCKGTVKNYGDYITIPIRSYQDPALPINIIKTCPDCGRTFVAHKKGQRTCGDCWTVRHCKCCGQDYINYDGSATDDFCSEECCNRADKMKYHVSSKEINYDLYEAPEVSDLHIEINDSNYKEFDTPGVWYHIYDGMVIQVHQCQSISSEYSTVKGFINNAINDRGRINSYHRMVWDDIDLRNCKSYVLMTNEPDISRRREVEAAFAIRNRCKYWRRDYAQFKIIERWKINNGKSINED